MAELTIIRSFLRHFNTILINSSMAVDNIGFSSREDPH